MSLRLAIKASLESTETVSGASGGPTKPPGPSSQRPQAGRQVSGAGGTSAGRRKSWPEDLECERGRFQLEPLLCFVLS
ncbi:hypothetical protein Naga_100335g1 [Nannochloropsis gaditana]|uniref:Uncharacterized protein n=1 Tax=Nannochloropsis gaditana TaxID=72520 RepID=W7TJM5_9STRA|nr:hypothetical protein Naga_100335g1 [Nannochloropsis gaditana]